MYMYIHMYLYIHICIYIYIHAPSAISPVIWIHRSPDDLRPAHGRTAWRADATDR